MGVLVAGEQAEWEEWSVLAAAPPHNCYPSLCSLAASHWKPALGMRSGHSALAVWNGCTEVTES